MKWLGNYTNRAKQPTCSLFSTAIHPWHTIILCQILPNFCLRSPGFSACSLGHVSHHLLQMQTCDDATHRNSWNTSLSGLQRPDYFR